MTSALERLRHSVISRAQVAGRKAVDLRALQEALRRAGVADVAGPEMTALYVLVRPDQDPSARLAVARAATNRAGYTVAEVLVEDAWAEDPGLVAASAPAPESADGVPEAPNSAVEAAYAELSIAAIRGGGTVRPRERSADPCLVPVRR